MSKTLIEKGYTLEIESWENDADNYQTHSKVFQDVEEIKLVLHMCENLFLSCNNGEGGIGNTIEWDDMEILQAKNTICEYLIENPKLLEYKGELDPKDLKDLILEKFEEANEENWKEFIGDYIEDSPKLVDKWVDFVMDEYNRPLLGYSESYYSRIYESHKIYYSDKNIEVKEVSI